MSAGTRTLSSRAAEAADTLGRVRSEVHRAIVGQDTFQIAKPDPRVLQGTIDAAGGARRAIMVGDSRTDIDTARNLGIPVVAVDFGYTDTPVRELDPDRVISHFDQLPAAVSDVVQAARLVSP